jgi:hypothetical protein
MVGAEAGAAQLAHRGAVVSLDLHQKFSDDPRSHDVYLSSRAIRWLANAGAEIDIDQYVPGMSFTVSSRRSTLRMPASRPRNSWTWRWLRSANGTKSDGRGEHGVLLNSRIAGELSTEPDHDFELAW